MVCLVLAGFLCALSRFGLPTRDVVPFDEDEREPIQPEWRLFSLNASVTLTLQQQFERVCGGVEAYEST